MTDRVELGKSLLASINAQRDPSARRRAIAAFSRVSSPMKVAYAEWKRGR